jgi:hypothetical protein
VFALMDKALRFVDKGEGQPSPQYNPTAKEKKKDLRAAEQVLVPFIADENKFKFLYTQGSGNDKAIHLTPFFAVMSLYYDCSAHMAEMCSRFLQLSLSCAQQLDKKLAESIAKRYGDINGCATTVELINIFVLGKGEEYESDNEKIENIFNDNMLVIIALCENSDANRQKFVDAGVCDTLWELLCSKTFCVEDPFPLYLVAKTIRVLTQYGRKHSICKSFVKLGMSKEVFLCLEKIDDAQTKGDVRALSKIKDDVLKGLLELRGHSFLCLQH